MRYTGPKNRIARREATDLGLKTIGSKSHARLLKKLNVPPGQHGASRRKKTTEAGFQLREKQKLRYIFGLTERQLSNYFHTASEKKGNTINFVVEYLEKRLDNSVYRLGFAPTRAASRQIVSHGHVKVNDKRVNIPSYQIKLNDVVTLDERSTKIPYIEKQLTNKDVIIPSWFEKKAIAGKLIAQPTKDEITKQVNLRLIIEFYSR
ncbi:MAG: 30S ribosomal protein S4 [bacterium]|nr:30S ribosomal protein S4 [bacterium]